MYVERIVLRARSAVIKYCMSNIEVQIVVLTCLHHVIIRECVDIVEYFAWCRRVLSVDYFHVEYRHYSYVCVMYCQVQSL